MRLLVILTLMIFQSAAQASMGNEQFLSYLKNNYSVTPVNLQSQTVYDYGADLFDVEESLFEQLLSIAQDQSQIWGDTVLEGDVWSLGDVRVDQIEFLKDGEKLLGYRITYSQKAWDTASCDLSGRESEDYKREETFAQCAEGRIYESSFVTADLNRYFADYDAVATLELND